MSRLIRTLWNGPFFAGQVPNAPTVGWVLLKLLECIYRALLCILGVGIAASAVATLWPYLDPPLSSKVIAIIKPNDSNCRESEFGTAGIEIHNESNVTVGRTEVRISAFRSGVSTDLVPYSQNRMVFNGIIEAGTGIAYCITLPELGTLSQQSVAWSASINYASELSKNYVAPPINRPIVIPPSTTR